ncbi:hypothetical protein A9Q96_11990 [Rhodobacterales bacterium 52_120_T64]|nr:hypothetical protein A9Q96_11990 [Rhodobacterales bacterium 52_120_T64]
MNNTATPTPRNENGPRYAVVAQALIDEILSGRYPVGSNLPTENMLCKQFKISRHTTREAIRQLQELGLVTRRAGFGTTVKSDRLVQRYVHVGDTVSDLYQYAQDIVLRVTDTSDIETDAQAAALLGCKQGQRWLKLHGLRVRSGETLPISLTDIHIPHAYRQVQDDIENFGQPIYSLIQKRFGLELAEVRQQVSATTLQQHEAEALLADQGAPALRITRHYYSATSELFEISLNLYPAERFTYSNTLRVENTSLTP